MVASYWTEHEFADAVGLTVWGVRAWRRRNYGPPFYKLGRRVVYASQDVDRFFSSSRKGGI